MDKGIKTSRGIIRFSNLVDLCGETVAVYGTGSRAQEVWNYQKQKKP